MQCFTEWFDSLLLPRALTSHAPEATRTLQQQRQRVVQDGNLAAKYRKKIKYVQVAVVLNPM